MHSEPYRRSSELMSVGDTALLVIDVQEKLLPAIHDKERVLDRVRLALRGAKILGVPTLVTEQYPKGLGRTVPGLADLVSEPVEKVCFSSCGAGDVLKRLEKAKRIKVLVVGIEAHVCVQQTVLDLLASGFEPYIAVDAIGSRRQEDKDWAVRRMIDAGAAPTTAEAAVFEWTESASHPRFKEISQLIKETMSG